MHVELVLERLQCAFHPPTAEDGSQHLGFVAPQVFGGFIRALEGELARLPDAHKAFLKALLHDQVATPRQINHR